MRRISRLRLVLALVVVVGTVAGATGPAARGGHDGPPAVALLAGGLDGGSGSTVGPDGALYVTETRAGRVSRIDPDTGAVSIFADGLPRQLAAVGLGGPMDVAFVGHTAYVLETLVGGDVGGTDTVGIYRIDGPHSSTVVADIGTWSVTHPPATQFDIPSGVQYAMQPDGDGFLVTDGHHNRVLQVGLDGSIRQLQQFTDIVPTGLERGGNTIYMAEAGPIPHLPQNGKIVSFGERKSGVETVAAGGPLLVDVEYGPRHRLYGLAQGHWSDSFPGTPADPNTGELLRANGDGTFTTVVQGLDRPTSLEFIHKTAYIVTLTGQVWRIDQR